MSNYIKKFNKINNYIKEQYPPYTKYECLNEYKSWGGAMRGGALEKAIFFNENKVLFTEAIEYEFAENKKGGIIIFSTEVNAIKLNNNKLINWVKQKIVTLKQGFTANKQIDKIAQKHNLSSWTVGHFFSGRYTDKNGKQYGENSLSLEIIGISFEELIRIAEELCSDFKQETVLVKDYYTNRILLINPF
jgi:hypothetical protein